MAMSSAFCCTSLKTGTLIVGWLSLIVIILVAAATSVSLASKEQNRHNSRKYGDWEAHDEFENMMSPNTYYAIYYVATLINIVVLICLLYGTNKGRRGLLMPYLVVYGIAAVTNVLLVLFLFVMGTHWLELMPKVIAVPIGFYFLAIVYSHYKELNPENQLQDPKSQAMRQAV